MGREGDAPAEPEQPKLGRSLALPLFPTRFCSASRNMFRAVGSDRFELNGFSFPESVCAVTEPRICRIRSDFAVSNACVDLGFKGQCRIIQGVVAPGVNKVP